MNKILSVRIASILLVLHGLIEISGMVLITSMPHTLISFGGLTGPALEQNAATVTIFGVLWGLIRFAAAVGSWSLKKWGLALGIAMSLITLVAAVTVIPAGVADTLFAGLVLIFMLYAWFGNQTLQIE